MLVIYCAEVLLFLCHHVIIFCIIIGECGPPEAADGVMIHNYTTTFEGSSITFTCENGLFPKVTITANCTREGHWSPDPTIYMCMDVIGKVF